MTAAPRLERRLDPEREARLRPQSVLFQGKRPAWLTGARAAPKKAGGFVSPLLANRSTAPVQRTPSSASDRDPPTIAVPSTASWRRAKSWPRWAPSLPAWRMRSTTRWG